MSSINLLPKKIRYEESEERQKRILFTFSVLLLIISVSSYLGVHIDKTIASDKSKKLSLEMKMVSADIEKEIENNELFLTKNQIKDIAEILGSHSYFSRAFGVIQNITVDGVYLKESNLSLNKDGNLTMGIGGAADSYLTIINQIAVFKNSYWIDNVEINDISLEDESGVSFSGSLEFKGDVVLFHEDYWNFGLSLLSSKIDRYLEINEYSAELEKIADSGEKFVKVKFGGVMYDTEKPVLLENDLKQMSVFVKNVSISYDLNEKNDDNTVNFNGEMELIMP